MPAVSVFTTHPALRGVALMIAAVGVFALLDATGKYLAQSYPVPGIVWARYAVNLGLMLGWFVARGLLSRIRTSRLRVQALRGLMLGSATLLYMTALSQMPMADAAAIGFVMPLIAAVLAVPMLNERLDGPSKFFLSPELLKEITDKAIKIAEEHKDVVIGVVSQTKKPSDSGGK